MKKVKYLDNGPIAEKLKQIYLDDPKNSEDAIGTMVMYILHKSGLAEDGITVRQFEAALDAYLESSEALAGLINQGIAPR